MGTPRGTGSLSCPPPPPELLALFSANRLTPRPLFSLLQDSHLARAPPFATASGVCGPLFPPPTRFSPSPAAAGLRSPPQPESDALQQEVATSGASAGEESPALAQRSPSAGRAVPDPFSVPRTLSIPPGWKTHVRREKLLSRPRSGTGGGGGEAAGREPCSWWIRP